MRKLAVCLFVSAFAASTAFGGTVAFDFVSGDADTGVYDVSIDTADYQAFDAAGLLIGAVTPGLTLGFALDPGFVAACTQPPADPAPYMVYDQVGGSDMFAGGFNGNNDWAAPLLVGTLTVSGLAAAGPGWLVQVNSGYETATWGIYPPLSSISSGGGVEGLEGSIPEPATLMLLGLGGLAMLRRRK